MPAADIADPGADPGAEVEALAGDLVVRTGIFVLLAVAGAVVVDRVPDGTQVWSLTQFYSFDFSQSRIGAKKVRFLQTHNQGLRQLLTVS